MNKKQFKWIPWVFSGIGVAIITFFINFFAEEKQPVAIIKEQHISRVQAGGDVNINQSNN